ncbi:DUF2971 domain-containing protein [Geobacillus sp. NFOSA3]|jgi:Protein of unknown function (DUF2971)|nr:DUF2971 domain-containing protein [Geobacillus sp. NFOSA3]
MWKKRFIELLFPINRKDCRIEDAIKIKYENIPSSLYKYREVNKFSLQNLENDEVWITTADTFNDPYDCALTINQNWPLEELKKILIEQFPKQLKQLGASVEFQEEFLQAMKGSQSSFKDVVKFFLDNIPEFAEKQIENEKFAEAAESIIINYHNQEIQRFIEQTQKGTFISCFSEINNSILMWSHYAGGHTGFCVEYDFKQLGPKDILTRLLYPVIYTDKLLDMAKYFSVEKDEFNIFVGTYAAITKSLEWSYEKEWRLVFPLGSGDKPFNRKVPKPTAIYLGAKISQENREKLIEIAGKKGIPVYQMKIEYSHFKLIAEPVFYPNLLGT